MATSEDSTASPAIWRKPPAQPSAQAVADYDHDFFVWTCQQAEALRAGRLDALDLKNLAEEVESMGIEQLRGLESHTFQALVHLALLQFSPAVDPRDGWITELGNFRWEIDSRLEKSPSLRPRMEDILARQWPRARRQALTKLRRDAVQDLPVDCPYRLEEVLNFDWLPPHKTHP